MPGPSYPRGRPNYDVRCFSGDACRGTHSSQGTKMKHIIENNRYYYECPRCFARIKITGEIPMEEIVQGEHRTRVTSSAPTHGFSREDLQDG